MIIVLAITPNNCINFKICNQVKSSLLTKVTIKNFANFADAERFCSCITVTVSAR
jgi:hypothetical protein